LVEALLAVRSEFDREQKPVLFLTNDNMVRVVGQHWNRLEEVYRLSWSGCREAVLSLLDKDAQVEHCKNAGSSYPESTVIHSVTQLGVSARRLSYPLILKPTRPLSSFKVFIALSPEDLVAHANRHSDAFPMLAQRFIPGGEDRIRFYAAYFRDGKVISSFLGQKLRSRPMGHTTAAVPCPDPEFVQYAGRFFQPLGLTGPASLEIKLAADGTRWVIEPTVGRTDFWVKLCIANGADLPWAEFCDQVGIPYESRGGRSSHAWFLTERDPFALASFVGQVMLLRQKPRLISFAYFDPIDLMPYLRGIRASLSRWAQRVIVRVDRVRAGAESH
jgi:predicted ATP-grasp superfamily ATP-dependent carboligase